MYLRPQARVGGRPQAGFTLMEILIAMVVLMIGLVGIMSVFPHALRTANNTVEKSYAVTISQSVLDAIRLGLTEMRTPYADMQGFVLDHDGSLQLEQDRRGFLKDLDLARLKTATGANTPQFVQLLMKDYFILLPRPTEVSPSPTGGTPIGRAYLFPRDNIGDNASRRGIRYVDFELRGRRGRKIEIKKTYPLGRALRNSMAADEVTRELERGDPLSQYSFAFTIRPTKGPDASNPSPNRRRQKIIPGLYEVSVFVFRNFNPNPNSFYNQPIERFVTYVGAQ